MASFIALTDGSITVIDASKSLDVARSVPIDQCDEIDIDVWVQSLTGAPKIDLYTSMQNQFDDIGGTSPSWVKVMNQLAPANAGHNIFHLPATSMYLLRYMRWAVTASAGQAITFTITGMARRKSF